MAQLGGKQINEELPDLSKFAPGELEQRWKIAAETRQRPDHLDDTKNAHDEKYVIDKVKDKAEKLKTKIKKKKHDKGREEIDSSSEEEDEDEDEEEESKDHEEEIYGEANEFLQEVTKALAGLDAFGTRDSIRNDADPVEEEDIMKPNKDPTDESSRSEQTNEGRGSGILITEQEEMEIHVDIPSIRERAGEAMGEATEAAFGFEKDYQERQESGETKPISSTVKESAMRVKDKVLEAVASVEYLFEASPEKAETGKSWGQWASDGVNYAEEKLGGSGAHDWEKLVEKTGESKPEEGYQGFVGKAQDKVGESVSDLVEPFQTREPIGEVDEVTSTEQPPHVNEEHKSGVSEIVSVVSGKASSLVQGFKEILTFDRTGSNNVKESGTEGERKEREDKATHQPMEAEAEAEAGKRYAEKFFAAKNAIASKLGYGGQTPQHNVTESKAEDQTHAPKTDAKAEDMKGVVAESKDTLKSSIVAKLSPGEEEKALSEVITDVVSHSAVSVKDSILGGFYRGSGKGGALSSSFSTIDTSTVVSLSSNLSASNDESFCSSSGGRRIVTRLTGAVSSLLGRKQGEDYEHSSSHQLEQNPEFQIQEPMPLSFKPELQMQEPIPLEMSKPNPGFQTQKAMPLSPKPELQTKGPTPMEE